MFLRFFLFITVLSFSNFGLTAEATKSSKEKAMSAEKTAESVSEDFDFDRKEILKGKVIYIESEKHAYNEIHNIFYKGSERLMVTTKYVSPEGKTFATFTSDYRKHPYIPAYRFEDQRNGRVEGIEWLGENKIRIYGRKLEGKELESREFTIPDGKDAFAGQGFNFYIVDHLKEIRESEDPVKVEFILPLEQKSIEFRIKQMGEVENSVASFRAEVTNWLFRVFAPRIDVKYDLAKECLLEYKGPSNLLDKDNEVQDILITYDTSDISIKNKKFASKK